MGALLSTGETGRWVWGVGGVSSLVGVLWRGVGCPQMGSDGDEEQIVQSGTWDGDSTIPALASPADSPMLAAKRSDLLPEPRMPLRKITWLPSDASEKPGAGTDTWDGDKPGSQ